MPKFDKTSAGVAALLDELTAGIACEKRKMFGYPVCFINGNMFTGTFQELIIFRIPVEEKAEYQKKYRFLIPFEPLPGRIMKEYLAAGNVLNADKKELKELALFSEKYTRSLPEKKKTKK